MTRSTRARLAPLLAALALMVVAALTVAAAARADPHAPGSARALLDNGADPRAPGSARALLDSAANVEVFDEAHSVRLKARSCTSPLPVSTHGAKAEAWCLLLVHTVTRLSMIYVPSCQLPAPLTRHCSTREGSYKEREGDQRDFE